MSVLRCVGSKANCPFVRSNEEAEYEKALLAFVERSDLHPLHELGPSLTLCCRPFSQL